MAEVKGIKAFKRKPNGIAEDLGAIIGFSNTLLICGTRGGKTLYIPEATSDGHILGKLIGETAFAALVASFGGETIDIPMLADFSRYQRVRTCAKLLISGKGLHAIAALTGVTYNQVKNDRRTAEALGLLPMVFGGERQIKSDEQVIKQMALPGM